MTPKNKFSAAPSLLGYIYQVRLALLFSLQRDDEQIYIETLDDIAFSKADGQLELVQSKLHINRAGSLTDRSQDLWKTLRVWASLISNGTIDLDQTIFRLVTSSVAPAGSAAEALLTSDARDEKKAVTLLRTAASETSNAVNLPSYAAFNALSGEQQDRLIGRIEVLDAAESITDLRDRILKQIELAARAGFLEQFFERLEGWWFNRVIKSLSESASGPILKRDLRAQIDDLRESFHQDALPIDFLDLEAPQEKDLPAEERTFIEQLRLVALSHPRVRSAIEDYYRAYVQRSRWLRDGLVLPGDLEKYESRLVDEWRRRFDTMAEDLGGTASEPDKRREGKALFNWCEQQADFPIRRGCTEKYVMRGSYHLLANELKVGWHTDFASRLSHLLKNVPSDATLEPENA